MTVDLTPVSIPGERHLRTAIQDRQPYALTHLGVHCGAKTPVGLLDHCGPPVNPNAATQP